MKQKLMYLSLLLSLLAGCGVQKKVKHSQYLANQEMIAKFADLPDAPFQAQLQKIAGSLDNHDQLQVFYTYTMPRHDLIVFYQQQMERLGWELFAESTMRDSLMHFSKPQQFCSILITQDQLSIYVCHRKGA